MPACPCLLGTQAVGPELPSELGAPLRTRCSPQGSGLPSGLRAPLRSQAYPKGLAFPSGLRAPLGGG